MSPRPVKSFDRYDPPFSRLSCDVILFFFATFPKTTPIFPLQDFFFPRGRLEQIASSGNYYLTHTNFFCADFFLRPPLPGELFGCPSTTFSPISRPPFVDNLVGTGSFYFREMRQFRVYFLFNHSNLCCLILPSFTPFFADFCHTRASCSISCLSFPCLHTPPPPVYFPLPSFPPSCLFPPVVLGVSHYEAGAGPLLFRSDNPTTEFSLFHLFLSRYIVRSTVVNPRLHPSERSCISRGIFVFPFRLFTSLGKGSSTSPALRFSFVCF